MSDISIVVAGDDGRILYSGNDSREIEKSLSQMSREENGYLFVREKNHLSLSRMGGSMESINLYDEKIIRVLKGLL